MACDNTVIKRFKVRLLSEEGASLLQGQLCAVLFNSFVNLPGVIEHSELSCGEEGTETFYERTGPVVTGDDQTKINPLTLRFSFNREIEMALVRSALDFWEAHKKAFTATIFVDVTTRNFCTLHTYVHSGCKLIKFGEPGGQKGKAASIDFEAKFLPYKIRRELPKADGVSYNLNI